MHDIVIGLLALAVGAMFCFRGYLTMRVIIPIWGAFGGFVLGAGLVASASDDGFLRTAVSWIVGFAVALVFGLVAYLYFEFSVVLAMTLIGFALGTSAMVAIGVDWSWLIVLVGIAVGVVLAVLAIAGNLPMVLLTVLTAGAGASAMVGGIMLLVGELQTETITETGSTTEQLHDDWWWYAIWGALFVVGIIAQISSTERLNATMREAWDESRRSDTAVA